VLQAQWLGRRFLLAPRRAVLIAELAFGFGVAEP
jgi:hypothetical protein